MNYTNMVGLGVPDLATAAHALDAALASGCDCNSQAQAQAVIDFQVADGTLTIDGKYGPQTASKLGPAVGGPPPPPCFGSGHPCFGKDAGANAAMLASYGTVTPQPRGTQPGHAVTPSPPSLPPGPTGPIVGPTGPGGLTPAGGLAATNWLPWAIGGAAILVGGLLVWAMQKQRARPASAPALSARRRPARRRSRRRR
jgi:hypothetical protein